MTNKNDKDILKESILGLKKYEDLIKKNMLSEATENTIKTLIMEANEDEDENEYSEDVVGADDDTNTEGVEDTEATDINVGLDQENETPETDVESVEDTETISDEDLDLGDGEEDFDMEQFKNGDDEYDLTNTSIENAVKVFKRVKDSDNIILTDLGDGKIELDDKETGADYMIDTNGVTSETETELDVQLDDEPKVEESYEAADEVMVEENDPTIEIELGPDEEGEGMVDEKNMTQSYSTNRRAGVLSQTRAQYAPGENKRNGAQLVRNEGKELTKLKSLYVEKITEHENYKKQVNKEISQLNEILRTFATAIKESAVTNNNLGKYVKLVTENSTTKDEKVKMLNRFANEAKTIEDGNKLYESITKELKSNPNKPLVSVDKQIVTESTMKKANEQVLFESDDVKKIKSMMKYIG